MRLFAVLFFVITSVQAAVVQGVVLDDETGNPLARTQVTLTPLPGTQAGTIAIRAGDRGGFTILSVRPGWYVLKTTRRGYAETEAGQLRPGRPGMPFEITEEAVSNFFQIRMRHLGVITGSVLDENNVGIPDWPVHLYTASRPVRRLLEGKTDERGNFRLGALDPGKYLLRSGAGFLEDDSPLLATWYKYGTAVETAEPVRVRLGETVPDITVRAVKGRLIQLGGVFNSFVPARLILITDTGRRQIAAAGPRQENVTFQASGIPPGPVELLAEGDTPGAECGGYARMIAEKDTTGIRIGCGPLYKPQIDWQGVRTPPSTPIMARRVDLDGTGPVRVLRPDQPVPPGRWEFTLQAPPQYYLSMIRSQFSGEPFTKDDGWFGMSLGNQARLQIVLTPRPASVSGIVSQAGRPVAGAAVYLELFNPDVTDKRLQLWTVRSDATGNYAFAQLAPGRYRVLSSFDFDSEDPFVMEKAAVVSLKEGDTVSRALDLLLP
jgi:hypothetical protein